MQLQRVDGAHFARGHRCGKRRRLTRSRYRASDLGMPHAAEKPPDHAHPARCVPPNYVPGRWCGREDSNLRQRPVIVHYGSDDRPRSPGDRQASVGRGSDRTGRAARAWPPPKTRGEAQAANLVLSGDRALRERSSIVATASEGARRNFITRNGPGREVRPDAPHNRTRRIGARWLP